MREPDIERLLAGCRQLPPGSFRQWGKANPVAAAVQHAMAADGAAALLKAADLKAAQASPAPLHLSHSICSHCFFIPGESPLES